MSAVVVNDTDASSAQSKRRKLRNGEHKSETFSRSSGHLGPDAAVLSSYEKD
jgi:hypothetical protein